MSEPTSECSTLDLGRRAVLPRLAHIQLSVRHPLSLAQQGAERNAQSYDNQTYGGGFQPSSSYPQDYYDDPDNNETYSYAQGSTRDDSNYVHLPSVRVAEPNEDQYSSGARGSSGYARGSSGGARGSSGYAEASTGYAQAGSGYVEARSGYAHAYDYDDGSEYYY